MHTSSTVKTKWAVFIYLKIYIISKLCLYNNNEIKGGHEFERASTLERQKEKKQKL